MIVSKKYLNIPIEQTVFVAPSGNDTLNDGSFSRPFATIPAALSAISLLPPGSYMLDLAPGSYGGAPILWPTNVSVRGTGLIFSQISHDISYITTGGDEIVSIEGLTFSGVLTVDLTLGGISLLFIDSCSIASLNRVDSTAGAKLIQVVGGSIDAFNLVGSLIGYNVSFFSGGPYVVDVDGQMTLTSCLTPLPFTINGTGVLTLNACTTIPSSVFTGVGGGTVVTDSSSMYGGGSVAGTAVTVLSDVAERTGYNPAVPANWNPIPVEVKEALDQLAAAGGTQYGLSAKSITLTVDGGNPTYYTTIQAAIDAIPLPASAADELKFYNIYIPSGNYDENLTIGPSRNISLIGLGTVILGSGSLSNHGSVTPRNITWTVDQTFEFGFSRPTLRILTIEPDESSSTHTAYSGGFIISGSLAVLNEGLFTSHELHLDGVKIFGTITRGTLSGLLSTYMRQVIVVGAITASNLRLQLADSCEFAALVSIDLFNRMTQCELNAGITVTANGNDLPPSGMFSCTVSGTFTGPAGSAKFDAATDYFFTTNGGVLGGAATKVRIALSSGVGYTPAVPGNWAGSPVEVKAAIDRLAAAVTGLLGGPIP